MYTLKKLAWITLVVSSLALVSYAGVMAAGTAHSSSAPVAMLVGNEGSLDTNLAPTTATTPTLLVEFTGIVESMSPTSWQIGGRMVLVDSNTQLGAGITTGTEVNVQAVAQSDGTWLAHQIDLRIRMTEFFGQVQTMGPTTWTVGGQTFNVDANTKITGPVVVGSYVHVTALIRNDGTLLAKTIALANSSTQFVGMVEAMGPGSWTIGAVTVNVSPSTKIDSGIVVGDQVRVAAAVQADGSLLALSIQRNQQKVTFMGVVEAMGNSSWTISGLAVTIDAHTQIDPDVQMGSRVKVDGARMADGTLVATQITAMDEHVKLVGRVESMNGHQWMVSGQAVMLNAHTQISGNIHVGSLVRVDAIVLADGTFMASRIQLVQPQLGRSAAPGKTPATLLVPPVRIPAGQPR